MRPAGDKESLVACGFYYAASQNIHTNLEPCCLHLAFLSINYFAIATFLDNKNFFAVDRHGHLDNRLRTFV